MNITPVSIVLSTTDDVDAMRYLLECQIDMTSDMLTDPIPYQPEQIRKMAGMSDEGIKQALSDIHTEVNTRATRLESLQCLLIQVNALPIHSR